MASKYVIKSRKLKCYARVGVGVTFCQAWAMKFNSLQEAKDFARTFKVLGYIYVPVKLVPRKDVWAAVRCRESDDTVITYDSKAACEDVIDGFMFPGRWRAVRVKP